MSEEWEAADGDTFESVVYITAEKLGIQSKVTICACCFVPPIKFCCAIGKTGDLFVKCLGSPIWQRHRI